MSKFLCILGGTGFSLASPRLQRAIPFLEKNPQYRVITSGLGKQDISSMYPWFEREFIARLLHDHGDILTPRIVIGKGGDLLNRCHRDDILQILNAVDWESERCPEFLFLTEGWLHMLRVQLYCRAQIPAGREANVRTMNCGPTDWPRRLKEIRSTIKCIWWLFTRGTW